MLLALAALGAAGCHARPAHPAHPARPAAPELDVVDLSGKPVSLATLRGKVVLLDFWATWCEPCQKEMPRLAALQRTDGPSGLQIVGLSMDDDPKTVRAFLKAHPLPYPVAMASAKLAERYGRVLGLPTVILIDRRGRIAGRHEGLVPAARLEAEVHRLLGE